MCTNFAPPRAKTLCSIAFPRGEDERERQKRRDQEEIGRGHHRGRARGREHLPARSPRRITCKSASFSAEQPRQALHKAGSGRHAQQHRAVHLDPRRELCKPLCEALGRDHHGDKSPMALIGVWHAGDIPEDGCSTVSSSRDVRKSATGG